MRQEGRSKMEGVTIKGKDRMIKIQRERKIDDKIERDEGQR